MMSQFILCISLSLLGTAMSIPLDDYIHRTYHPPPYASPDMQDVEYSAINMKYNPSYRANKQDVQLPKAKEQEVPLPAIVTEELEKQLQRIHSNTAEMQILPYEYKILMQGGTIGIQMYRTKYKWLSCKDEYCSTGTCPNLFMEGNDWDNCGDNVFQVYHPSGPGTILVGDLVGLYYPADQKWFSMYQHKGHKQPCPGTPNIFTGFENADLWKGCGAEIFQIFAMGKHPGQVIENHDIITLYFTAANQYVRLDYSSEGYPDTSECPIQNPNNFYDVCQYEVLEITVR